MDKATNELDSLARNLDGIMPNAVTMEKSSLDEFDCNSMHHNALQYIKERVEETRQQNERRSHVFSRVVGHGC